jgi:hypothetical protein
MTYWEQFKNFINSKEVGTIITRKEMQKVYPDEYGYSYAINRVDQFRWMLMRGGFLNRIKPGRYELIQKVPDFTTKEECIALVKRDNLRYVELIQRRRNKKKRNVNRNV